MRAAVGVLYWFFIGFLAFFVLYVSVGENRLWFGLLIPVALAFFGAWWPGLGYSGTALIAFGVYPALLITRAVLLQVFSSDWSCSTASPTPTPTGGWPSGCPPAAPPSPST